MMAHSRATRAASQKNIASLITFLFRKKNTYFFCYIYWKNCTFCSYPGADTANRHLFGVANITLYKEIVKTLKSHTISYMNFDIFPNWFHNFSFYDYQTWNETRFTMSTTYIWNCSYKKYKNKIIKTSRQNSWSSKREIPWRDVLKILSLDF